MNETKTLIHETDLIIFDCDGVLVDSEPISNRIVAEELSRIGLSMETEEAIRLFAGTSIGFVKFYYEQKSGKKAPADLESRYRQRTQEAFESELSAVPFVDKVLEKIKTSKCVASNGPIFKIGANLKLCGLEHHFEEAHRFSAYEIGFWKPEPHLYLHAAAHFAIDPGRCLVIEDSVAGVQAARAAGMPVFGFAATANAQQLKAAGAEVFYSMEELLSRF